MTNTPLFLDEQDELYGYGVLNVHNNTLITSLGDRGDPNVFATEDALREHYEYLTDGLDSDSHLRIVEVGLSNELDEEVSRPNDEQPENDIE